MFALFILPVAVIGAFGALVGLVNGGTIIVVALAADQWQRWRGYRNGEGVCTDREGGHIFGLKVAKDATDLGQFLAGMVEAFPDLFKEFDQRSFDLTVSEGEFLRMLVKAAQGQLVDYLDAVEGIAANPEDDQLLEEIRHREARLRDALVPVAKYLKDVPASRVKKGI